MESMHLRLGDEGDIILIGERREEIVLVSGRILGEFNLFNESRQNFSWEKDCRVTSEICVLALEILGLEPCDYKQLENAVADTCMPSGPLPEEEYLVNMSRLWKDRIF